MEHDLWDSDFAAPPILLTVNHDGRRVDAVAATNKFGFVYIFDRVTGESLFPIVETKVPASTVPGEMASPTQPIPTLPAPLAKQTMLHLPSRTERAMKAMTMSRPSSSEHGSEEIWIATDGDVDVLIGKELRKLRAGTAYRVPSTGITAHANINASGQEARFLYLVK